MVVKRPSAISSVADDSVLLSHDIHELLNDRSWAEDNHSSGASEDDELQKEIDMLPSAERRVSQEISDLVRLFSNNPESPREKSVPPRGPVKLRSRISPMNQIYTKFTKKEDRFTTTNHETKRSENSRNTRANTPDSYDVHMNTFTRDVRQSPGLSQPSDEGKGNGIFGVSTREPPEEILFVEDDGTHDSSTGFSESTTSESIEMKFLSYIERMKESASAQRRDHERESASAQRLDQEEEFSMPSEWCLQSTQLSDLERGENDLFNEESFWEESFWKTPVNETALQATSATVRREQLRKNEVSAIKKGSRVKKARQAIIAALSMPTLDHKREKIEDHKAKVSCSSIESQQKELDQSIQSHYKELDKESADVSEQSKINRNMTRPREWTKPIQPYWKSYLDEHAPTSHTQTKVNNYAYTLHTTVRSESEGMIPVYKDIGTHRGDVFNWRRIVLVVHVIMNIVGGVVFIAFFR